MVILKFKHHMPVPIPRIFAVDIGEAIVQCRVFQQDILCLQAAHDLAKLLLSLTTTQRTTPLCCIMQESCKSPVLKRHNPDIYRKAHITTTMLSCKYLTATPHIYIYIYTVCRDFITTLTSCALFPF